MKLRMAVNVEGIRKHQAAFQAVAGSNGVTSTSGSAGYDASADYVAEKMLAAGYTVTAQKPVDQLGKTGAYNY